MIESVKGREWVILVGAGKEYGGSDVIHAGGRLDELRLLAETAGAEVVGSVTQTRSGIEPKYYIGSGKAQELKEAVETFKATTVIFDNDLSPAQVSNLEKLLDVKVIDRSELILDIFALRAKTREAKTQVELAQLTHLLPRLTRRWSHLSRQVGGIGVRGPGETQLEVDRRTIRNRIAHLSRNLKQIEKRMAVSRGRRKTCFKVTFVGYTNAGKSTLFNTLSKADAAVEDKLFKTLDSMSRMVKYEDAPEFLLSDTVGFIRDLPHELIASFKSTLNDVRDADLLLIVVDSSNPDWSGQLAVVEQVLGEIEVSCKETQVVFNKADLIEDGSFMNALSARYPNSLHVSALNRTGIVELKRAIINDILRRRVTLTIRFDTKNRLLLGAVYRYGTIHETEADGDSIILTFTIPEEIVKKYGILNNGGG